MDSAVTSERGPLKNMDTFDEASATTWKRYKGTSKKTRSISPFAIACMMTPLRCCLAMVICLVTFTRTYAHNMGVPAQRPPKSSFQAWQAHSSTSTFSSPHFQSAPEPCQSYACETLPKSKLAFLDYIVWRQRLLQQNSSNKAVFMAASGILNTSSLSLDTKDNSWVLSSGSYVTGQMSTPFSSSNEAIETHDLKMRQHRLRRETRKLEAITDLPKTFQSKKVHSFSSKISTTEKKAWQIALEQWVASLLGGKKVLHGESRAHEDESKVVVSSDAKILNAANDLKSNPWMGGLARPFVPFFGRINLPATTHLPIAKLIAKKDEVVPSVTEHISSYLPTPLLDKTANSTISGKESAELAYLVSSTTTDKSLGLSSPTDSRSSMRHTRKTKVLLKPVPFIRAERLNVPSSIGSTAIMHSLSASPVEKVRFASTTVSLKGVKVAGYDFIVSKLFPSGSRNTTDLDLKDRLNMTLPEGNISSGLMKPSSVPSIADLVFKTQSVSDATRHWITSNVSHQSDTRSGNLISQFPFMNTEHKVSLSPHTVGLLALRRTDTFRMGSSGSVTTDKPGFIMPIYKFPNQTITSTENLMRLASSAQFAIDVKLGTNVMSTTEMPLPVGDATFPYFSTSSMYSTFGVMSDRDAVTHSPHEALNIGLDLEVNHPTVPLRPTSEKVLLEGRYLEPWQEKSPSVTSLPIWPTRDTLVIAGSLRSHTDFSRLTFADRFDNITSTEMYVKPTTASSSHQTNILKDYSPVSFVALSPVTPEHFSMESNTEQNEESTISNIFSPVSTDHIGNVAFPTLNFSSTLISSNSTNVLAPPNSSSFETFTSLYQAKSELISSTQKTTSVPSTNISSSPCHVVKQSVPTHLGAQSNVTSEQRNTTVSPSSLTSKLLVTVTLPFFKLVSNGSSTSLPEFEFHLQPLLNISFPGATLKTSQTTHRNNLESFFTAVVTKPLIRESKTSKTIPDSTYPTMNMNLQTSLLSNLNTSIGASVGTFSSFGIMPPSGLTSVEKAALSVFSLNQSTVLATKASRLSANVSHSTSRMIQPDVVAWSFTPFRGMTESNHSAINLLPDLNSGVTTIRANRSKRTLPKGYSNTYLTEPAHMKNDSLVLPSCFTCTSVAPVISGNELVHSFSTVATGSTSSTPGPAKIQSEWTSNLNDSSRDWPRVTLSISDIKAAPPFLKSTPLGLVTRPSVSTTYYKTMKNVLGSSMMVNASKQTFDPEVQVELSREDKMPSSLSSQEIENTDSTRNSDVATPRIATSSKSSSDLFLFHTEDASWSTKSNDWLTSTSKVLNSSQSISVLPDVPKRFDMAEEFTMFDMPDPLQPTGTEASNHIDITVSENALTQRGILGTEAFTNFTLVKKQTVPPIAQAAASSIGITERRAHLDVDSSYVLKHDPSISPSILIDRSETAKSNSSSVSTSTSTHTNMQHTTLDLDVFISSMRDGEMTAVTTGSKSVTNSFMDSRVAESSMNIPIQTANQNATSEESSYLSTLQLNVTTASNMPSRLETSLMKTTNVPTGINKSMFSITANKLSPTNLVVNKTSKKGVPYILPLKKSTMANSLHTSSSVSPSLQPYTVPLQHNCTATVYNYNTTAVSQAPQWINTSVVLLDVTSPMQFPRIKLSTSHSSVVTQNPNTRMTLALLGAKKSLTGRARSTGTVDYRHHTATSHIPLKATIGLSNYSALLYSLSTETESSVAALLSNTTATRSDFQNVSTYKLHLGHSNKISPLSLKLEHLSSSTSQNLSSLSTGTIQNVTPSSLSLSLPTKHLGSRVSESLTSTMTRSFTTIPVSLLTTSAVVHFRTRQTSSKNEAHSMSSVAITNPLVTELASLKDSLLSTKLTTSLPGLDPLLVREPKTTLNFTTIGSQTSETSEWMASMAKTDPTLLESLVLGSDVPLFEMPTKSEPTIDELAVMLGTLPLRFCLAGIPFTEDLQNKSAATYKKLEHEVILTLNKMFFSRYGKRYLQTNVLLFLNDSLVVFCEVKFRKDHPIPSSSDIIRTVVTEVYKKASVLFNWSIDVHSLQSKNYTLQNLEPEMLSVSFCTLRMGFVALSDFLQPTMGSLSNLKDEVTRILSRKFAISLFQFVEVRNIRGDLFSQGDLYIDTQIHTDVHQILQLLKHLVNQSVDLTSLSVNGVQLDLQVFPITFRVINRKFDTQLLDHSSLAFQNLTRDLSTAVFHALSKDHNFLQVVIRDVLSGFVLCRGDLIFQKPAPTSQDVLQTLISSIGSDKILAGSAFKVAPSSLTVGDSKPDPFFEYTDFPGFAVAIIVMCGLSILFIPILAILFMKSGMLGHRNKATIQRRHDAEMGQGAVEMDNRGFSSSPEQP
uniref:Mucin-3A-like n=1 Tax=Geotrypetes seraphini TaxID=260995 RepID=A0A6P8P7K6_GEOSA|nr:mucin-3A-like [Geotrypetes seraphini]XP_033776796.1 mucin-3A-like [Geotrypetes seraphini]